MKRLIKVLSIVLPISLVSLSIVGLILSNNKQELSASDGGDTTYQTFIFYDDDLSHDSYKVAFTSRSDHGDVDSMTKYDMKHVNDYIHAVTLPTSVTKTYLKFYYDGNSGYKRTGGNNTTMYFNTEVTGFITGNTKGLSIKYLNTSATTRRLWFSFSYIPDKYFPTIRIDDTHRYVMNKILNSNDTRDYYFVDVPMSITSYGIQYIGYNAERHSTLVSTSARTNEFMHQIKECDGTSLEDLNINRTFDENIINEYLRGFVSCSSSDINGFGAFSYIQAMVDRFESHYGGLSSVYQEDYEQSDFVDGQYLDTSIREGEMVSAQEKYDALERNSASRGLRPFILHDEINFTQVIIITSIGAISLLIVTSYALYRRHKTSENR